VKERGQSPHNVLTLPGYEGRREGYLCPARDSTPAAGGPAAAARSLCGRCAVWMRSTAEYAAASSFPSSLLEWICLRNSLCRAWTTAFRPLYQRGAVDVDSGNGAMKELFLLSG